MKRLMVILTFAAILIAAISSEASAQRRVTPVAPPAGTNANPKDTRSNIKETVDAQGNVILIDTITGTEVVDTTAFAPLNVKKMIYPLMESLTVGVNIWDGAMRALGQHYGIGGIRAQLSLHNRYFPMAEVGLGTANDTPDGMNFTYRSSLAPYLKLGIGYNVFYNSNPDYRLIFGLRYGLSNFSYRISDVTVDEGYWGQESKFSIASQRATAGWMEFGAGLHVKIARPISLGWEVMYHSLIHQSHNTYGPPMIIPGYGKRHGAFAAAFYVMYTLGLSKNRPEPPAAKIE